MSDLLLLVTGGDNLLLVTGGDRLILTEAATTAFTIPDARWEMPALLTPGQKPVGAVAIDRSKVPGGFLCDTYLCDTRLTSLGGLAGTLAGSATVGYDAAGGYTDLGTVAGTKYIDYGTQHGITSTAASSPWSVYILVDVIPNGEGYFWGFGATATGKCRGIGIRSSNTQLTFLGHGANIHGDVVGTAALTGLIGVGCTWDGTTLRIYLDGLPKGSGTPALVDITSYDFHRVGGNLFKNGYGKIHLCHEFAGTLSAGDMLRLHRDPYQFLIPA